MIQRPRLILAFTATLALGAALPPVLRGSVLRMLRSGQMTGGLAGPLRRANPELAFAPAAVGGGLIFNGPEDAFVATGSQGGQLPTTELHVGALVSVETPRRWGGIVGAVEDNADAETGWVLGYDDSAFTLMISTEATDDGNGAMVTLRADRPYAFGRLHLVTASYDGERAELTMDGVVVATSDAPGGPILYSGEERLTVGAYRDVNEMFPHDGRIAALEIFDSPFGGKLAFRKRFGMANQTPWTDATFDWAVEPYLTWPSTDAVSVLGESTWPSEAVVLFRPESQSDWTEAPSRTPGSR
ncbi:MAG: LamG-like jellyroll fold domain-containing protein, partial [Planctomycetota bacterium]